MNFSVYFVDPMRVILYISLTGNFGLKGCDETSRLGLRFVLYYSRLGHQSRPSTLIVLMK